MSLRPTVSLTRTALALRPLTAIHAQFVSLIRQLTTQSTTQSGHSGWLRPAQKQSQNQGLMLNLTTSVHPFNQRAIRLRSFHTSPENKNAAINTAPSAAGVPEPGSSKPASKNAHLEPLSTAELVSYLCIGLCTINKPILDLCIKVFPYVPMFVIKALVYRLYCGGETIEEVKQTGRRLADRNINNMMLSLTIEACDGNDNIDPKYIVAETKRSVKEILLPHTVEMIESSGKNINDIPPGYVALKPTGFTHNAAQALKNYQTDPKFEEIVDGASVVCQQIYDINTELAQKYPSRTAPFVVGVIDAEKYDLQEGVYELQRRLYKKFNPINKPISVVGTLQMYLSGSANLLALEEKLAQREGYRLGLKLVRGAYIHSEAKRATVIHKTKEATDRNYDQSITYCMDRIVDQANQHNAGVFGHLVVALHNEKSARLTTQRLKLSSSENTSNVVLGQLLGMADNVTYDLVKNENVDNIIKYVAWGPPLETKEYLLRRLEENGDAVRADNGFGLVKEVLSIFIKRILRLA